jgi:hypothetical protein
MKNFVLWNGFLCKEKISFKLTYVQIKCEIYEVQIKSREPELLWIPVRLITFVGFNCTNVDGVVGLLGRNLAKDCVHECILS